MLVFFIILVACAGLLSKTYFASGAAIVTKYVCEDGKMIKAIFNPGVITPGAYGEPSKSTGSVKLTIGGRVYTLPHVVSADGGRYANADESFVLWIKGDTAMIFQNGVEKDYMGCMARP